MSVSELDPKWQEIISVVRQHLKTLKTTEPEQIEIISSAIANEFNAKEVQSILDAVCPLHGMPLPGHFIKPALIKHLSTVFDTQKSIKNALDNYPMLQSQAKEAILQYMLQDHISKPPIDTIIYAVINALTDKSNNRDNTPITVADVPDIIKNYNIQAVPFSIKLENAYGKRKPDEDVVARKEAIRLGVRYYMLKEAGKSSGESLEAIAEKIAGGLKYDSQQEPPKV